MQIGCKAPPSKWSGLVFMIFDLCKWAVWCRLSNAVAPLDAEAPNCCNFWPVQSVRVVTTKGPQCILEAQQKCLSTLLYSTLHYSTLLYITLLYSTLLYSTQLRYGSGNQVNSSKWNTMLGLRLVQQHCVELRSLWVKRWGFQKRCESRTRSGSV